MSKIPVVDLTAATAGHDMWAAFEEIGFVALVGHGIDPAMFDSMRTLCAQVFAASDEQKQAAMITPTNYRGFIPLGFFTPNRAEVNGAEPDRYEGFKLHWECPPDHPIRDECALYGSNRWIDDVPQMASTILSYWAACETLADQLLTLLAPPLGVAPSELTSWHQDPLTNMTLLHYPAQPATDNAMGIHPHKDTNVLTFLHPDPVGGLQVRARDGAWIEAEPPAEALLVNSGEMLELWSGGRLPATPHRVINSSGRERYSFPWFLVPRHDIVVEPLQSPVAGYVPTPMPVGDLSAEVWRTNWADQEPSTAGYDLGSLDRSPTS